MDKERPLQEHYIKQITNIFGQPLTSMAEKAAEDFWDHWEEMLQGFSTDFIKIRVDMFILGTHLPKYKRHYPWQGLGGFIFLCSLVILFFSWKFSVLGLMSSFLLLGYANHIKMSSARKFQEGLVNGVIENNMREGMATICAQYIAGTIQLRSIDGQATWPRYPSCVLGGETRIIPED